MKLVYDIYNPVDLELRSGVPIILVHGLLDCRKTWKSIAPAIANSTGRNVYAVDLRNHGDSPWCDASHHFSMYMDIVQFLEDHGIPKATFIGHSLGGFILVMLALKKPEKVEKLILEDLSLESNVNFRRMNFAITDLFKKSLEVIPPNASEETAKIAVRDYLRNHLPKGTWKKDIFQDLETMPLKKLDDEYMWKMNMGAIERETRWFFFPELTAVSNKETLILYGTSSFFNVQNDRTLTKIFPKSKKVRFEGVGHFLHEDSSDMFLEHVLKFIRE